MPVIKLIADSGSTKTDWCVIQDDKRNIFSTQGLSPYFLNAEGIERVVVGEVHTQINKDDVAELYFYGTGCKHPANKKLMLRALKKAFPNAGVSVDNDLSGAAKALCGHEKGIACILGTGSNSCYYNGKRIVTNSPGLGYVLGDEGSGSFLGKKVIQHYLYGIFEDDMRALFDATFITSAAEILDHVYKKPLPNRYLASFAMFLAQNRGNYMIENIIEDGLNEFLLMHVMRYPQARKLPVHFTGSIAYGFQDVILQLCLRHELTPGHIYKTPMEGLINYHQQ